MSGKHIELFLVDGIAGGITTAEIAGWTGHVLSGPRSQLAAIRVRDESSRNGVYLLLGDAEASDGVRCYIGRTENFVDRLRKHDAGKDFWNRVVLVTSQGDSFNEGHWSYLESRLVEIATAVARVSVENDQIPKVRKLSEAQRSDMEAFITQLQIVLPVLGINAIRTRETVAAASSRETAGTESPTFTLTNTKLGVNATAQVDGDEFVLLAGSTVVGGWTGNARAESAQLTYASLRAQFNTFVADGTIEIQNGVGKVTRDIPFSSPSRAGSIAQGRSGNGKLEWKWSGGTYAQWQDRGLND